MGLKQFLGGYSLQWPIYGEVPLERGTFFQVYERAVRISLVEEEKKYGGEICPF